NGGSTSSDTVTVRVNPAVSTGPFTWSTSFGGLAFTDTVTPMALAVTPTGDSVVAGYFSGTVDLGTGAITSAGGTDIFVVKYSAGNGSPVWVRRYGSAGNEYGGAVAVDTAGAVYLTGGFSSSVDFGGTPLTSAGNYDVFLLKLSSGGTAQFAKRFGAAGDD